MEKAGDEGLDIYYDDTEEENTYDKIEEKLHHQDQEGKDKVKNVFPVKILKYNLNRFPVNA